ncbi:MAG: MFS transporter [Candidatus Pacebacteria bacterium]|jgi:MFS family permease|nr:MFS transporter [Candidatus Paceibacterota bacterium]MBT4652530.1 MFS transporter [Candidatus Paceibacterota bacterium]MBT6756357.1 MFS transporter [Candidatus Paceibacterota bacterium]MBT6921648.1 MFS transporter [Candidatus Paceibacterota bacterium]
MHLRSLHFFKFTKYSSITEVLALNNVLYWGGDTFVSVVLALFVTQYIEGSSASSVGIAYMIYRLASSLSTASVGRFLDEHKGYRDEIWALFFASIIAGMSYIGLGFATNLWHLYLVMAILGVCRSFDNNAWQILFFSHIEADKKGQVIGVNDAIYGVVMGAMAALSGFVGEIYGFRAVIMIAGILMFVGGFPVLSLRKEKSI